MRTFFIFLLGVIVGCVIFLCVFNHLLVHRLTEYLVTQTSGFRVKADDVSADFLHAKATVKGVMIYNPAGFRTKVFLDSPNASATFDLLTLFKEKRLRLIAADFELDEVNVEINEKGIFSTDLWGSVAPGQDPSTFPSAEQLAKAPPAKPVEMDHLILTLRRVNYVDYSGVTPKRLSTDLKMERETFDSVKDTRTVIATIMQRIMHSNFPQMSLLIFQQYGIDNTVKLATLFRTTIEQQDGTLIKKGIELPVNTATQVGQAVGDTATKVAKMAQENTQGGVSRLINVLTPAIYKKSESQTDVGSEETYKI